jgi:hypothetical protein
MTKKNQTQNEALRRAVEQLHKCRASHIKDVIVTERFGSDTVWEGLVSIFEIKGHPTATLCYAWSHSIDDSDKRQFFAVLQMPPIDSPQAAVRAAIVSEFKTNQKDYRE